MKKLSVNFLYNLSYKMLLILAPLVTTPYLARTLGAGAIGEYSYVSTLVNMFLLVGGLGSGLYAQRGVAQRRDNLEEKSLFCKEVFLIRLIGISVSLGFFLITAIFSQNSILYLICSIEIVAYIFDISWLYQGEEDFGKVLLRNFILKLVTIILIYILIKSPKDIYKYALLRASSLVISNLSIWPFVKQHVLLKLPNNINLKKHIAPILKLFIPQISTQLYSNSDKIILKWVKNDNVENGYYDQTYKVIEMGLIFVQALSATVLPRLSYLYASGKKQEYKELLFQYFRVVIMFSFPMAMGLYLIAGEFAEYFFGDGYEKVGLLLKIYSPYLAIAIFSGAICQQYLVVTGKEKRYMKMTMFGAIFNIIVNLYLIPVHASIGAVISTILSECMLMVMAMRAVSKDGIMRPSEFLILSKCYVIASIIMAIVLMYLNDTLPHNVFFLVFKILLAILIYVISLAIMKEPFVREIWNKISQRGKNSVG